MTARDLAELADGFASWVRHRHPGYRSVTVRAEPARAGGYSNDVVFVALDAVDGEVRRRGDLVLRLPPRGPALFRTYDLEMQAEVQQLVRRAGVAVPAFVAVESDASWLGAPFLLMPRVAGRVPGELPVADEWLMGLVPADQRKVQLALLDALARVHGAPWEGTDLAGSLRGASATLLDEVDWWIDLMAWTFDGAPPPALATALAWCRGHVPTTAPPRNVLWGDVRLGNVVLGDDLAVRALLDWEMASIGPAESDLAWYTALDEVSSHVVGRRVPGFLDRDDVVAQHETALRRPLVAFRWFEIFAMCRAAALNLRTDVLAAARAGRAPRPPERDLVLRYAVAAAAAESGAAEITP